MRAAAWPAERAKAAPLTTASAYKSGGGGDGHLRGLRGVAAGCIRDRRDGAGSGTDRTWDDCGHDFADHSDGIDEVNELTA